MRGALKF